MVDAAEASARHFGLSHKRMVSRAYHDSLFMALFAPTGMIFIPCRGGVSHRPDEFAADKDIEAGTKVSTGPGEELQLQAAGSRGELKRSHRLSARRCLQRRWRVSLFRRSSSLAALVSASPG